MRYLLLIFTSLVTGCVSSPPLQKEAPLPRMGIIREIGRHQLPFQLNERFILQSVAPEPGVYENTPLIIVYILDGKRKDWRMGGPRSTDGYVTELGWYLRMAQGVDGDLMEERVIRLPTGEQITVAGSSVQRGEVRLRTLESSESERFGKSSRDKFVKLSQRRTRRPPRYTRVLPSGVNNENLPQVSAVPASRAASVN